VDWSEWSRIWCIIKQFQNFWYILKSTVSQCCTYDTNIKLSRFQKKCGTIPTSLKPEALRTPQLRFHRIMAVPPLMYNSGKWALYRIDRGKI
jgi:hypothetical protein